MKYKLVVAAILACATAQIWALERSVPLPYDYSRSVNQAYVPACTANQYVGVSGTQFVCRNMPSLSCDTAYVAISSMHEKYGAGKPTAQTLGAYRLYIASGDASNFAIASYNGSIGIQCKNGTQLTGCYLNVDKSDNDVFSRDGSNSCFAEGDETNIGSYLTGICCSVK